jgi:hypothetical protein
LSGLPPDPAPPLFSTAYWQCCAIEKLAAPALFSRGCIAPNYFRVKDATAFEAWCHTRSLDFWTKHYGGVGDRYAVSADTGDSAGWPCYDSKQDDIDLTGELAKHLDPRDIAVLIEIGSEKLRYLTGIATAVHHSGRTLHVDLNEIYDRAIDAFDGDLTVTDATH